MARAAETAVAQSEVRGLGGAAALLMVVVVLAVVVVVGCRGDDPRGGLDLLKVNIYAISALPARLCTGTAAFGFWTPLLVVTSLPTFRSLIMQHR